MESITSELIRPMRRPRTTAPTSRTNNSEPLSAAERARIYRQRRKQDGLAAVKCYLPADALAYLHALCKIHHITVSRAIAMALANALRGETGLPDGDDENMPGKQLPSRDRPRYTAAELMIECDLSARMPEDMAEWDRMPPVGREIV